MIEIFFDTDNQKNNSNVNLEDNFISINSKTTNFTLKDLNDNSKYIKIYTKNAIINISKIQKFYRQYKIKKYLILTKLNSNKDLDKDENKDLNKNNYNKVNKNGKKNKKIFKIFKLEEDDSIIENNFLDISNSNCFDKFKSNKKNLSENNSDNLINNNDDIIKDGESISKITIKNSFKSTESFNFNEELENSRKIFRLKSENLNLKKDKKIVQNEKSPNELSELCNLKGDIGKFIFPDGSTYLGEIEGDKTNGFGIFYSSNKDIFKGIWKNDVACGIGGYKSKEFSLMGYWENNKQNSFGIYFIKKSKTYYEGEFNNGKKEGNGILLIDNGKYEGVFKNDKINGIGSFYFKDERIYHGEWVDNKMEGIGLLKWNDGRKYEGYFKDNKKEGFGVFYSDNKIYYGNWKNSRLEGDVIINEKGNFNLYEYKNGKKIKKSIINNKEKLIFFVNINNEYI
jgi:hypothetical protein